MNGSSLSFDNPIRDAISRIRFAPVSNNLLISSWDSSLRFYDVDKCELRTEAPTEGAALLDCCFESESMALSANSDGSILRYDLRLGNSNAIGTHEDSATCVEYSEETSQIISAGWDKNVKFWDARSASPVGCLSNLVVGVESMSLSMFNLMVALKSSVHLYDLRYLNGRPQVKEPFTDIPIKCVRSSSGLGGFMVGSTDGRVALEYLGESNSQNDGLCGVLVTGDNEGHATIWDVQNKKRLMELPKYPNSAASLAYNHSGQLLAVASSYTYQEANEREELPQIFLHHTDDIHFKSPSASSSMSK
ncbi:mitotic checkpoint protein bub3.3 [Phtheirospermum japonicum]|uniref:Mitotic checkpoint protein bub3.3 n=1 Tax=Phtheirospermum japonicum TaxID=374723 RepID=A0A830CV06_9LAMI|nr:mitotic checkpoint protein bub3.3 [Phtheirospermum japonicum]